jgi:hypothetical protein
VVLAETVWLLIELVLKLLILGDCVTLVVSEP